MYPYFYLKGTTMGNINSILQLINPDNTITANRALAHAIGMTETIIYSALISKYSYYEKLGKLFEDEWFYCTYDERKMIRW